MKLVRLLILLLITTTLILILDYRKVNTTEYVVVIEQPIVIEERVIDSVELEGMSSDNEIVDIDPITHYGIKESDIIMLAKTLYGECRGVDNDIEKAAVAWCILNRVDKGYGTIEEVIIAPNQFTGYDINNPLNDDLMEISKDVLIRWYREKSGESDVGRVLPSDYIYFSGDGRRNWFRSDYYSNDYWDWDCINVYDEEKSDITLF